MFFGLQNKVGWIGGVPIMVIQHSACKLRYDGSTSQQQRNGSVALSFEL
jgi:hypothetical protein